jgi:glutathione peroxidase
VESIYDLSVTDIRGAERSLKEFSGKVLLIVNVASECGFTPQYEGLEALYQKYKEQGLEILGFPCNQFGGQEPGDESQIAEFCSSRFGISFPMFSKVEVNGDGTDPLFSLLKSQAPGLMGTEAIKWNFTKFLVSRDGQVIGRYASTTKPESMEGDIKELLSAGS